VNAKDLFDRLAVPYQSMELDVEPNGAELIKELIAASGQHTVPNIYINGKPLGSLAS
jgi:glutaredoxin 3